MRTKKLFSVALSTALLSVFLFLVLFIRIGVRYHENDVLTQFLTGHHEFTPFTTSLEKPYKITQYLRNVPMEEMDFCSYDARIKVIQAAAETANPLTLTLPFDLTYYRQSGNQKIPAYTLKKGTEIVLTLGENSAVFGYGLTSFPTYKKGWRYAVPFTASDEEPIPTSGSLDVLSQNEYDYYYVRLRDLYRIAATHFRTYPEYHDRVYEMSVRTVLWADWRLFTQMMYDSPDLSLPLFDTADFCLLGGAVLSLTIAILLNKKIA